MDERRSNEKGVGPRKPVEESGAPARPERAHDLESQQDLLRLVRQWTVEAVRDAQGVYPAEASGTISRITRTPESPASFTLRFGEKHSLSWWLRDRKSRGQAYWVVSLSMRPEVPPRWRDRQRPRSPHTWSRESVERVVFTFFANADRQRAWRETALPPEPGQHLSHDSA